MMRENEQARCFMLTTIRVIHHGLIVVLAGHFAWLILINLS